MRRFTALISALAVFAVGQSTAHAGIIFSDDFESYANTAALTAAGAWGDAGPSTATLNTTNGNPGQSAHSTGSTDAVNNFTTSPVVTDANPLVLEYDYFDDTTGPADRLTLGLRNSVSTAAGAFIELGEYNSADPSISGTGDTLVQGYAVRAVFAGAPVNGVPTNNNWYIITTTKVPNVWHHFRIKLGETFLVASVDSEDDGDIDASITIPLTAHVGKTYNQLRWGGPSNVSSTGEGDADNVLVAIVPEPSSLILSGLGLVGVWVAGQRRRDLQLA